MEIRHFRLEQRTGSAWLAGFLDTVGEAVRLGLSELRRLQRVEEKGQAMRRAPVITASALTKELDVTPQARHPGC